jgi:hypothetical protein
MTAKKYRFCTFACQQKWYLTQSFRIRRNRKFLGLSDPDPLVRGTDPDPSIIKQKK